MNTEYDSLNLDDILNLSRSDAEHAGDMAEQARVLRQMSDSLQDKVDLMRGAMQAMFGIDPAEAATKPAGDANAAWHGQSSSMMKVELDRLFEMATKAPQTLRDNATTMDEFSTKAHANLIAIDQLHVRSKGHGSDTAAESGDTDEARQIMQTATTDYLRSAEAMPEPPFYRGLRQNAPDDTDGDWTARHGAPATVVPTGSPTGGDPSPRQPTPYTSPTHDINPDGQHNPGPTLQSPGPMPAPQPTAPPVGMPAPTPFGGPGPIMPTSPGPGLLPIPRPTTPPVIGPRPISPVTPPVRPAPVTPPGTVRPVIGTRPVTTPPVSRPMPNPTGTVRPVIGTRPGGVTPVSRPTPNPTGTVRPVIGTRPGGVTPYPGGTRPPLGGPQSAFPGPRPGTTLYPGSARPVPNPAGTVRPVIGSRPGMNAYPAGTRPMSTPGGTPMTGGARPAVFGPRSAGVLPRNGGMAPAPVPASGRLSVNPHAISPTGQVIARPVVGAPAPEASATSSALKAKTPSKPKNPPGQRVKRVVSRGRAAIERSIVRGVRRSAPARSRPGQEVFAKFAKQKTERDQKPPKARPVLDPNAQLWFSSRATVPAVITGRARDDR